MPASLNHERNEVERLLFSVEETATKLSMSKVTIRKMCRDGRIKSVLCGDRRLIPAVELERIALNGTSQEGQTLACGPEVAVGNGSRVIALKGASK
jgi:excisionase family DNA binding protein